jgi:hypothetical protein
MTPTESTAGSTALDSPGRVTAAIVYGLLVVAIAFAVHGVALDNGLSEIDDPLHLLGARDGFYPSPLFRPGHAAWMRLLHGAFGSEPLPYYLAGLALHALNALLVTVLIALLTRRSLPALLAGVAFAALYAPHEVVLWISAHTSTLLATFVLTCACCFAAWLRAPAGVAPLARSGWYAASLIALALAAATKEECVVLAALLPALDLAIRGRRAFFTPGRLVPYVPFALLAAVYLALALRPEAWSGDHPGAVAYAPRLEIVPKVIRSFGHRLLPVPAPPSTVPWYADALGAAFLLATLLAAWRLPRQRPLLLFGLVTALFGLLPTAPGPFPLIIGRYGYVADVGVVAILAAGYEAVDSRWFAARRHARALRVVAALLVLAWVAVQARAVHSIDRWRYEPSAQRLESLLAAAELAVLRPQSRPDAPSRIVVVSPQPIWNEQDYEAALRLRYDLSRARLGVRSIPFDAAFLARFGAGGDLDPASTRVLVPSHGGFAPLLPRDPLPLAEFERRARERERLGLGRTLAVFEFRAETRR